MVKVDLGFGLKMVKACDPGARLKMVKVPRLPDPYIPPVAREGDGSRRLAVRALSGGPAGRRQTPRGG